VDDFIAGPGAGAVEEVVVPRCEVEHTVVEVVSDGVGEGWLAAKEPLYWVPDPLHLLYHPVLTFPKV